MPSQGSCIIPDGCTPCLVIRKIGFVFVFICRLNRWAQYRRGSVNGNIHTQYVNNLAKWSPCLPMEEIPHARTCKDADHGIVRLEGPSSANFWSRGFSHRSEAKQDLGATCVRPLRHHSY